VVLLGRRVFLVVEERGRLSQYFFVDSPLRLWRLDVLARTKGRHFFPGCAFRREQSLHNLLGRIQLDLGLHSLTLAVVAIDAIGDDGC
jgi:hypothetical protein